MQDRRIWISLQRYPNSAVLYSVNSIHVYTNKGTVCVYMSFSKLMHTLFSFQYTDAYCCALLYTLVYYSPERPTEDPGGRQGGEGAGQEHHHASARYVGPARQGEHTPQPTCTLQLTLTIGN